MGASASIDQVQVIYSNVERAVPRTPRGSRDVKNCTIKVWDAATGECVATLEGHSDPVWRGVFFVFLVCVIFLAFRS